MHYTILYFTCIIIFNPYNNYDADATISILILQVRKLRPSRLVMHPKSLTARIWQDLLGSKAHALKGSQSLIHIKITWDTWNRQIWDLIPDLRNQNLHRLEPGSLPF